MQQQKKSLLNCESLRKGERKAKIKKLSDIKSSHNGRLPKKSNQSIIFNNATGKK